jgi:transposase
MDHARHECHTGSSARRWPKKSDAETEALGRSRGGFSTKIHAAVDALGNPLGFILTPGQAGDCPQAEALLCPYDAEAIKAVLADKGYDSRELVAYIESLEAQAVIPSRSNSKEPREIDGELYKERNKIERFFGRIKHFRRVATRYEKTARNYMAFLHLASITVLLL